MKNYNYRFRVQRRTEIKGEHVEQHKKNVWKDDDIEKDAAVTNAPHRKCRRGHCGSKRHRQNLEMGKGNRHKH